MQQIQKRNKLFIGCKASYFREHLSSDVGETALNWYFWRIGVERMSSVLMSGLLFVRLDVGFALSFYTPRRTLQNSSEALTFLLIKFSTIMKRFRSEETVPRICALSHPVSHPSRTLSSSSDNFWRNRMLQIFLVRIKSLLKSRTENFIWNLHHFYLHKFLFLRFRFLPEVFKFFVVDNFNAD